MICCALAICSVFLLLALVCASFLSRVEGQGDVMSSLLGDKCVFATRTDSLPWCFVNRAVPCCHGPYLSCSGKHRSNLGPKSELLGNLLMENIQNGERGSYHAFNTLMMLMLLTLNMAWTGQTGMGQFQC